MQYAKDPKQPKLHCRFPQYAGRLRRWSDRPSGKVYKAKHRKHPKVHTRCPPYAGTLQAGRQGAVSERSKAAQTALQISSVCRCTPQLLGWARRQGAERQCPPCGGPREKEACTNTLEKWREKCCEHHWPLDLLTAARSTPPGRRCRGQPFFMGFSWGFHGVFMGFSWGFHGVSPGVPKCYEFMHKITLLGGPRGPQGHRPA